MKVLNPDYVETESGELAEMSAKEAELRAWFASRTDKKSITFKKIRNLFGKTEDQWPDGLIHHKLNKWGFEVINE